MPALLAPRPAVRFLSCEPLLRPFDLERAVWTRGSECSHGLTTSFVHAGGCCCRKFHRIGWAIAGGEPGPGARPMSLDWARSLRGQCTAAEVPFPFKQWGVYQPTAGWPPEAHRPAQRLVDDPIDALAHRWEVRRVGKKAAGRELDGRTGDEFPHHPAGPSRHEGVRGMPTPTVSRDLYADSYHGVPLVLGEDAEWLLAHDLRRAWAALNRFHREERHANTRDPSCFS